MVVEQRMGPGVDAERQRENRDAAPPSGDSGGFQRVAEAVVLRAAELLGTHVAVSDANGTIIASSDPAFMRQPLSQAESSGPGGWIRVPFQLEGSVGEVAVAGTPGGEVISPRFVQVLVDLVVSQVTVVDRLPHQHELKDRFISDLLHHTGMDTGALSREAKVLGIDLSTPRAVILIDAAEYILGSSRPDASMTTDAEIRRRAQRVIGSVVSFFKLPDATICAYLGDGEVVVLKASNSKNLEIWLDPEGDGEDAGASWANLTALKRAARALVFRLRAETRTAVNIGIGRYHPGVRGFSRSFEDARAALSLGGRFKGQNQVHCLDGLGLAAFVGVADERTKIDLATYLLSPLDHEPELLESLEVFFREDCCPSSVAKQLSIHRNTLSYRLDKVKSLTGLDPHRFDDAVQIRLAFVLRALAGPEADCADAHEPVPA
ncbi:MAG TPA: helix-turn-helix domain-containing protein [Thermomicrobiales bacterium]|nr:helix-turn-helix domain-containing protein [Thermomicrobiales bacterium]